MNQNCNNKKYNSSTGSSGCYFHRREIVIGICALCLNERLLILASKQASSTNTSSTDHRDRYFRSDSSSSAIVDQTGGLFRRNRKYWFSSTSSNNKSSSSAAAVVNSSYAKIFAFGSYFFNTSGNRLEVINLKSNDDDSDYDDCASTASQDDSFISIKIEDNGDTSWEEDKTIASKVSLEHCNVSTWNHSLRKETPKRGVIEPFKEPSIKESKSVIEHAKPRGTLRWRKRIGHLFQLIKWKRSNKTNGCHVNNKVDGVKIRKSWIRTLIKRRTTQ